MQGAQSLERAILILRVVGHHNRSGVRLTDVAAATSLPQPTTHRILSSLAAKGLVAQDKESKRYFLGSVLAEFGITAAERYDFIDLCKPSMGRLASESADTAFISKRSGMDLICLDRRLGTFPSKAFVLDVGVRRPLGVGASGLALLLGLPLDEARCVLQTNAKLIGLLQAQDIDAALADLARFSLQGYALHDRRDTDVRSMAVPIRDGHGVPFACFSISAPTARMTAQRIPSIVTLLKREAAWVQSLIKAGHAPEVIF